MLTFEAIIEAVKQDATLRETLKMWICGCDPENLIRKWFVTHWDVDSYDLSKVIRQMPDGCDWMVLEQTRYSLGLAYCDFNDGLHAVDLNINTEGTPDCCLKITNISVDFH